MTGSHPYLVAIATVSTLVSPLCCQNVSSGETRRKLDGSAVDFDSFREQFRRMYEVNSEEFNRRHLYFQVGDKRGDGETCRKTPVG